MTDAEKLEALKLEYDGGDDDAVLSRFLQKAKRVVIDHLFPLGEPVEFVLPTKYDEVQIDIAIYLLNKRGAEGESYHSENGVNRSYESSYIPNSLLKRIVPFGKVF